LEDFLVYLETGQWSPIDFELDPQKIDRVLTIFGKKIAKNMKIYAFCVISQKVKNGQFHKYIVL